jgi:membrane-bound serine protease (ClpP class)
MKIWIPLALQIGALLVGILEVIIPSFGILTVFALALLSYSWYYILTELPQAAVWGFLLADVIIIPIALKFAFSILKASPFTHSRDLGHGTGLDHAAQPEKGLIGKTGIVESQLRPTGKAFIDNRLLEVSSEGEIIEKDTQILIIDVIGNKIIVEPLNEHNLK